MTHQRLRTLLATLGVTALMTLPRVNAQTPAAAAPEAATNNAASDRAQKKISGLRDGLGG